MRDIVKASQLGNMAAYVPTDCPTREKHGWLGDAQVVAEEAMFNLW
jgi:alpha-L-rhamnosidase